MLKSWEHYHYVNQSGCASIDGVDDTKKFDGLRLALNVLRVSTEDTESIFAVIASILWLGNLQFKVKIMKLCFYLGYQLLNFFRFK